MAKGTKGVRSWDARIGTGDNRTSGKTSCSVIEERYYDRERKGDNKSRCTRIKTVKGDMDTLRKPNASKGSNPLPWPPYSLNRW